MNKVIKVKDNNQNPALLVLPPTDADSELQPKITTSSHACKKANVGKSAI